MDKTVRPPAPIALASPAGLVAMHLTQDEIQLLDAFRSMEAARQNACIDAASGLAHAFPRKRRMPALRIGLHYYPAGWALSRHVRRPYVLRPANGRRRHLVAGAAAK